MCVDSLTRELSKRYNKEFKKLFQRLNIANETKKKRLAWAGHKLRRIGSIVKTTIVENLVSKRPLERLRLRWEYSVKTDVGKNQPEVPRKIAVEDRGGWREICLAL